MIKVVMSYIDDFFHRIIKKYILKRDKRANFHFGLAAVTIDCPIYDDFTP